MSLISKIKSSISNENLISNLIKLKIIDNLVEVYERNGSKHKEFTLKNEFNIADNNLNIKLKKKENLLKGIIKTL